LIVGVSVAAVGAIALLASGVAYYMRREPSPTTLFMNSEFEDVDEAVEAGESREVIARIHDIAFN
jgi:hypothetical protein